MPQYQGVDVNHPTIVEAIKTMVKQGERREKICKVVGMPHEVVQAIEREVKKSG